MSVGTHSETAFAFTATEDGESELDWTQGVGNSGSWDSVPDEDRLSNVIRLYNGGRFDTGAWAGTPWEDLTERVVSFWFRRGAGSPQFVFWVETSAGNRRINFYTTAGTNGYSALDYKVYLGTQWADGTWHRLERDLAAVVSAQTPGVTYVKALGMSVWTSDVYLDDVRFSNSMTVEHNTLAPGSIGHIARNRVINQSTYAATDRWFHYDQVGSVMCTSDSNGNLASTFHPDAFGNMMASWQTGLWTDTYSARAGWHHNTM